MLSSFMYRLLIHRKTYVSAKNMFNRPQTKQFSIGAQSFAQTPLSEK